MSPVTARVISDWSSVPKSVSRCLEEITAVLFHFRRGQSLRTITSAGILYLTSICSFGQVKCGPPTYACASNSSDVVQLPNPLPYMGDPLHGVNTRWTEDILNGGYIRVTDADDDPYGQNSSFVLGDAGDTDWINGDSTLFLVQRVGGLAIVKTWNKATRMSGRTPITFLDSVIFDPGNPNVLWERSGLKIYKNLITDRSTWAIQRTLAFDFGADQNCLPNFGKVTWTGIWGISEDGSALTSAYSNTGAQETGVYIAVYYPRLDKCRVLQTETGQVTGDFGPIGPVTTDKRFTVHDAGQTPNHEYATVASNFCFDAEGNESQCTLFLIWETRTLNLRECGSWPVESPYCDGHGAAGFNGWAKGKHYVMHPYDSPDDLGISLMPFSLGPLDEHGSWPQIRGEPDQLPAFTFTTWVGNPQGPNTVPFQNELVGFDSNGSGEVYREGFNWNSGLSSNFSCQNGIGRVSPHGNFALVTSDGEGSFGSQTGPTCDLASGNCRCDIIAIPLR